MAQSKKRRIRRSVSMPVEVYWRLLQLSELNVEGENPSQVIATAIHTLADRHGVARITREEALRLCPAPQPRPTADETIVSQHFTF